MTGVIAPRADGASEQAPGSGLPDLMRRVERVVGICQPCLERHLRRRIPLPLAFVQAVERNSGGQITWFICPHSGSWHLRFPYDDQRVAT